MDDRATRRVRRLAPLVGVTNSTGDYADLAMLFQSYRPSGRGLEEVFTGMTCAPELQERMERCFAACARPDWRDFPYFVPRRRPMSRAEAQSLATQHASALVELCMRAGEGEAGVLVSGGGIAVLDSGAGSGTRAESEEDVWIREVVSDLLFRTEVVDEDFPALKDAYYSIANDYFLRFFLSWPEYRPFLTLHDPFEPYFAIWSMGASVHVEASGRVVIDAFLAS